MKWYIKSLTAAILLAAIGSGGSLAQAANLTIFSGSTGNDLVIMREQLDDFTADTGHTVEIAAMPSSTTDQFALIKQYFAGRTADIDVYMVDVIWAPQIDQHLSDLTAAMAGDIDNFFPSIVGSQTVNGRLIAVPFFTDAGILYYRKDLLDKYGQKVPTTWVELTDTARTILHEENKAGNNKLQGFVFQGNSYEGLTCDALEWVSSNGGGNIVEADGTISINNENAAYALEQARSWIGSISPAGVLAYGEEEARAVWQSGNAIFMRNWPYAYSLGQSEDSPIRGKFDVATLPSGVGGEPAATLGGWNLAVSKYSKHQEAAISLVKFLTSSTIQKDNALRLSKLPTRVALYDDADVAEAAPFFGGMVDTFLNAVSRPSAPTKRKYNEVSKEFFSAVHNTLSGNGSATENLRKLEARLKRVKGSGW